MDPIVVVGGGIVGLFSALYLANEGPQVVLVEKGNALGGLFRSSRFGNLHFEKGTRYALSSGIPEIDNILLADLSAEEWHCFSGSLPEAAFFKGTLCTQSGCIDTRLLKEDVYLRGLSEFLSIVSLTSGEVNLEERLRKNYGDTFTDEVYMPVLSKLLGCSPSEVAPDVLEKLHLSRLIGLSSNAATRLKYGCSSFDSRLAFERIVDGGSSMKKFFPKKGPLDAWVQALQDEFERKGGEIEVGKSVDRLDGDGGRVSQVTLSDGRSINCSRVIWTLPPQILLKRRSEIPPLLLDVQLVHLIASEPPSIENHWVTIYDDAFISYRITLYSNISSDEVAELGHRVTVEVMPGQNLSDESLVTKVVDEIKRIGVFGLSMRCYWSHVEHLPKAVPIKRAQCQAGEDIFNQEYQNLILVGAGQSVAGGQVGLLKNAFKELQNV